MDFLDAWRPLALGRIWWNDGAGLFYLAHGAASVCVVPWLVRWFGREGGAGLWPLARLLGLWLPAWLAWYLAHLSGLLSLTWPWIGIALLLAMAASGWSTRDELAAWWRTHWRPALGFELLYLMLTAVALRLRAGSPAIHFDPGEHGAEKFTDMAMAMAVWASERMPPDDSWLAGIKVHYYYLGHAVWALWWRATGIAPEIGYNIGVATTWSMGALLTAAVILHLTRRWWMAGLGAMLLCAGGNPLSWWTWRGGLAEWSGDASQAILHYDVWGPSRAIEHTITEFPAFSVILGDLHAHTHGWLLVLGWLLWLAIMRSPAAEPGDGGSFRAPVRGIVPWCLGGWFMGAMGPTNSWDLLATGSLGTLAMWLTDDASRPRWRALLIGPALAVLGSLAVAGPFWVTFRAGSTLMSGSEPDLSDGAHVLSDRLPLRWVPDTLRTPLIEWSESIEATAQDSDPPRTSYMPKGGLLAHWGALWLTMLVGLVPFAPAAFQRMRQWHWMADQANWKLAAGLSAIVMIVPWMGGAFPQRDRLPPGDVFHGWSIMSTALLLLLLAALSGWPTPRGRLVRTFLGGGLLMILGCELVYLDDVFAGDNARINSVFKIYYVAWPWLGIGAFGCLALGIEEMKAAKWFGWPGWGHLAEGTSLALLGLLCYVGAFYPIAATTTRLYQTRESIQETGPTLDGWSFARQLADERIRDDYALFAMLREETSLHRRRPVVLEAAGGTYNITSRFASNLGWRGYMGWEQHSNSWRGGQWYGKIQDRKRRLDDVFGAYDEQAARTAIEELGADAVVWGSLEQDKYPDIGVDILGQALRQWRRFQSGGTVVWLRPDE